MYGEIAKAAQERLEQGDLPKKESGEVLAPAEGDALIAFFKETIKNVMAGLNKLGQRFIEALLSDEMKNAYKSIGYELVPIPAKTEEAVNEKQPVKDFGESMRTGFAYMEPGPDDKPISAIDLARLDAQGLTMNQSDYVDAINAILDGLDISSTLKYQVRAKYLLDWANANSHRTTIKLDPIPVIQPEVVRDQTGVKIRWTPNGDWQYFIQVLQPVYGEVNTMVLNPGDEETMTRVITTGPMSEELVEYLKGYKPKDKEQTPSNN